MGRHYEGGSLRMAISFHEETSIPKPDPDRWGTQWLMDSVKEVTKWQAFCIRFETHHQWFSALIDKFLSYILYFVCMGMLLIVAVDKRSALVFIVTITLLGSVILAFRKVWEH